MIDNETKQKNSDLAARTVVYLIGAILSLAVIGYAVFSLMQDSKREDKLNQDIENYCFGTKTDIGCQE